MRFLKFKFLIVFLLICLAVNAYTAKNDNYQQRTLKGIELAYNMQFEQATEIFSEIIALDAENPHGYLLQSVNYYYRYQLEENHQETEIKFLEYSSKALGTARKKISNSKENIDALFYLGTANMYLAAYHGWESNWLKAYWYGKEGIKYLEKVIALDPNYYDAYLGLGLYHYYADIIPKYAKAITFLLGVKADRVKGLNELKIAAEKGTYSKIEAMLFLGSINLYIEKNYQMSLTYFETLTHLYPDNLSFLMLLGENYQKVQEYDLAVQTLNKLVKDGVTDRYPVLIISSYFRLGNLFFNLRNYEQAIKHYSTSLQYASASTGNVNWVFALANLNLGKSYDILKNRTEAVIHYEKVKKSDHKYAYKIARELIKQSYEKPAKKALSAQKYSKNTTAQNSNTIYESVLSPTPDHQNSNLSKPEISFQIAKIYFNQGVFLSAIERFEKIIAMQSVEKEWIKPWCHFYLGVSYKAMGNLQQASAELDKAYEYHDPELRSRIDKVLNTLN